MLLQLLDAYLDGLSQILITEVLLHCNGECLEVVELNMSGGCGVFAIGRLLCEPTAGHMGG